MYQSVAEITALFERLVAELPAGTATVHMRHVTLGTVIEVKPTNPACANFDVLTDDFEPYSFGIGRSTMEPSVGAAGISVGAALSQ